MSLDRAELLREFHELPRRLFRLPGTRGGRYVGRLLDFEEEEVGSGGVVWEGEERVLVCVGLQLEGRAGVFVGAGPEPSGLCGEGER